MNREEELSVQLIRGEITQKEYDLLLQVKEVKVGTRIKCTKNYEINNIKEEKGTIVHLALFKGQPNNTIGIEFDEHMHGHNCNGKAKQGHGWYIPYKYIEIINE